MLKIKFKEDMFVSNLECIEKDTIMYLKESKDHFSIHSESGQVIARYDYCLKDDIYNYFNIVDNEYVVLPDKTIQTHLSSIKRRFEKIKSSLEELEYWNKENDLDVIELIKRDIQKDHRIIQRHLEYLSRKF